MNEKPLERLNYFNGQRLQAADLKLEQDYHIRVRRWLNRSLYDSGIATGLGVYPIKDQPRVRVTPGLAIDHLGREVILLEEAIVDVVGGHHEENGRCVGPYLTIRYREDVVAQQDASCVAACHSSDRTAWGGPARILAGAVLELYAQLPTEASGRIPLACLTLSTGCERIDAVDHGVRRYIGRASANKVKQYALEGVRDVSPNNDGIIRFHIRGRQPASVTLFLRSEEFPSYFYTEIGSHTHGSDVAKGKTTGPASGIDNHSHAKGTLGVGPHSNHTHGIRGWLSNSAAGGPFSFLNPAEWLNQLAAWPDGPTFIGNGPANAPPLMLRTITTIGAKVDDNTLNIHIDIMPKEEDLQARVGLRVTPATLSHAVTGVTGSPSTQLAQSQLHTHDFSVSILAYGATTKAEEDTALHFVDDLRVFVDNTDVTARVLAQIRSNRPSTEDWSKLGTGGAASDPLVANGTDAIRLDYLVPIDEREHVVTLKVPEQQKKRRNGGRIHFNLYVE